MANIDHLIKQSLNPFGIVGIDDKAGNFWAEEQSTPTVESIHQEALTQIESVLSQVISDRHSRTLLLYGDVGVGKTYFLGRLKQKLNDKAFFAYIEPYPQSDYIWRHILRYTVDSMVNIPEGQTDSQLILWIKNCLSTIRANLKGDQLSMVDKIRGLFGKKEKDDSDSNRQAFIDILKKTVKVTGIYNANEFFGVLYDLNNPELFSIACEWLKGDDLDDESLKRLRVKKSIDSEDAAQKMLANFSKISGTTQPIVLCFDQLDNVARLPDGKPDLQALFNVNSAIYNGKWQGLLILVSMRTSQWADCCKSIQASDLDRVSAKVQLTRITLIQGEQILATRLHSLHSQAKPKPQSNIYPVPQEILAKIFPGKTTPRNFLKAGSQIFQSYKEWLFRDKQPPIPKWMDGSIIEPPPPPPPETFQLLWGTEFRKIQQKVTSIRHFSAPELIKMLQEVLSALQFKSVKLRFLPKSHASYSLSYKLENQKTVGIAWTEEPNQNSLCSMLKACREAIQKNSCRTLYLIRAEKLGKAGSVSDKIFSELFANLGHLHVKPDLASVHFLATYHKLVNDAHAGELAIGNKTLNLEDLEALVRDNKIFDDCPLIVQLQGGVIPPPADPVKKYLFNLVKTQSFVGRKTLVDNAINQFPQIDSSQIQSLIEELCVEKRVRVLDPKAKLEAQLVCLIPDSI